MRIKIMLLSISLALVVIGARPQTPIDTTEIIKIGGIRQFISVKGAEKTKPLLLFITGGPGESSMGFADMFTKELKKHFVLVQWDQRECGNTLALNHSPQPITLETCQADTRELVDSLLAQFHQEKLFLMGWSWGTVLGFYMAANHPELLHAYFAVSPVINQLESERLALNMLKNTAESKGNREAIDELAQVRIPFENMNQVYFDRKWLFIYDGQHINQKFLKSYFSDPGKEWIVTLFNEASTHDLTAELPAIRVPIYFFVGKKDYQTNHSISEKYFQQLQAPKKQFFLFEKSGHGVPVSEPALFQQRIITEVIPAIGLKN